MMNIGCKAPQDLKTFSQQSLIVVTFITVTYISMYSNCTHEILARNSVK